MQLLKGLNYKSVTLDKIKEATDSIYFAYGNTHIPFANYECSSNGILFNEFLFGIQDMLFENSSHYEYILIWTNETEMTILSSIDTLLDIEEKYCTCLVVACKNML